MFKSIIIIIIRASSLDTEATVVAVASNLAVSKIIFIEEVVAETTVEDLIVATFYIEATTTTLISI